MLDIQKFIDEKKHIEIINHIKNLDFVDENALNILAKVYFDYENFYLSYNLNVNLLSTTYKQIYLDNACLTLNKLIQQNMSYVDNVYELCDISIQLNIVSFELLLLIYKTINQLENNKIYDYIKTLYDKFDVTDMNKNILFKILSEIDRNTITNYSKEFIKKEINNENISDDFLLNYLNVNKKSININTLLLLLTKLINPQTLFESKNDIINDYNRCLNNYKKINDMFQNINFFSNIDIINKTCDIITSYYFCYYGFNCIEIYKEFNKLLNNLSTCFIKTINKHIKTNKIKIGIISVFITQEHSVSNDRLGIIKSLILDDKFDVKIITNKQPSQFYNQIMNNNDNVIVYTGLISNLISKIIDLDFDIILYPDIGMYFPYKLLTMHRLAPIQINTWGHSETSGIDTIDYFISSTYYEPENAQNFYTEKLIKLNSLCTYYYNRLIIKNIHPNHNRYLFGMTKNQHLYCCMITEFKIHPDFIETLIEILEKDKLAIFIFISFKIDIDIFTSYLEIFFKNNMHHVKIFEMMDFTKYMNFLNCVDIVLDSYPFGGCNSTIDAFNVNKIVITLPSEKLSGRFSYGFYKKMNILEPICDSKQDYINKAIFYMNNIDERVILENKIKENKHLLFEEIESVNNWKDMLINLYNSIV